MKGLFEKIKNMVRFGRVSNPGKDSGDYPQSQVEYMKKPKQPIFIYPYGYSANAPLDQLALVINVGHEDNAVAFSISGPDRNKGLLAGEVATGNQLIGTKIFFDASGNVTITSLGNVTINAPKGTTINGDTTIKGNLSVSDDIDSGNNITAVKDVQGTNVIGTTGVSAGGTDFSSHVHSGVTTGASNTGPPV